MLLPSDFAVVMLVYVSNHVCSERTGILFQIMNVILGYVVFTCTSVLIGEQ